MKRFLVHSVSAFPNPSRILPLLAAFTVMLFSVAALGCGTDEGEIETSGEEDLVYEIGEPITDSTVAAIVTSEYGSDTLAAADFRQQVALVTAQYPQIRDDVEQSRLLRRSIVEEFVLQHAIFGQAEQLGLQADSARVESQLQRYRSQFESEEAYQQMLSQNQITEDSLRNSVREFVLQQQIIEGFAEEAEEPSTEELQAYREDQAEQVRARHILFTTQNADEAAVRQTAEAVLDSIKAGADFEEMAQRHSQDPGSAQRGGDLGYFSRGQMVPPFEETAYALQDSGDVASELTQTRFGFHIIQLVDRRTGELMDTAQATALLTRQRQQEAVEAGINRLRGEVVVRLNQDIVDADLNELPENM